MLFTKPATHNWLDCPYSDPEDLPLSTLQTTAAVTGEHCCVPLFHSAMYPNLVPHALAASTLPITLLLDSCTLNRP